MKNYIIYKIFKNIHLKFCTFLHFYHNIVSKNNNEIDPKHRLD